MNARRKSKVLHQFAVVAAVALGLAVATAVPAEAATKTVKDSRHDAFTLVDLTSVTVKNKSRELVIEVRAPDFRRQFRHRAAP